MLLSMTGFGEASRHRDGVTVAIEVRTINSRYFKLSIRGPEGYASFEPLVEPVVRKAIRRGTVQVQFRIDRAPSPDDFGLTDRAGSYRKQLETACATKWRALGRCGSTPCSDCRVWCRTCRTATSTPSVTGR